jgi:hypothetical protein
MMESEVTGNCHASFGERGSETRTVQAVKVRAAPTPSSPILSTIYLNELDTFMDHMKAQFDRGKKRAENREYRRLSFQIQQLRRKEDNLPDGAIAERQTLRQARKRQMEQR